ncbi:MAG: hypothetical protein JWN96_2552 [Mycobacterium sp.]|nr:hypothetical protein [Mycobacterium sp.]
MSDARREARRSESERYGSPSPQAAGDHLQRLGESDGGSPAPAAGAVREQPAGPRVCVVSDRRDTDGARDSFVAVADSRGGRRDIHGVHALGTGPVAGSVEVATRPVATSAARARARARATRSSTCTQAKVWCGTAYRAAALPGCRGSPRGERRSD